MQQEMDYMLAQNGMTEDAVKELTETFNTMSGRLHTLTPENVDAFVDELQQSIRIVAERNEESYTSPEFSDDFIKKIAYYVKADPSEAFAEDLMKNAQVVKIDGDNENAILSYKGHCMMARLDERQKQIVLIMSAIPPEQSVFTENGELAQGYSFAEIPEDMQGNAKLVLLNALCEQSDKTFVYDKEKEQRRILEEAKKKFLRRQDSLVNGTKLLYRNQTIWRVFISVMMQLSGFVTKQLAKCSVSSLTKTKCRYSFLRTPRALMCRKAVKKFCLDSGNRKKKESLQANSVFLLAVTT